MRLWSFDPSCLDQRGLCGLWREVLVGLRAFEKGPGAPWYNHPQLTRFKQHPNGLGVLAEYAEYVLNEGHKRGYKFNARHLDPYLELYDVNFTGAIQVTEGQFGYEIEHFMRKLAIREPIRYTNYLNEPKFSPHPIFTIVDGDIESWEKRKYA
jgi:Pyrimidine dimer DNA glycosylase